MGIGCSSSTPFKDIIKIERFLPVNDPKGSKKNADIKSNNLSRDVDTPVVYESEKVVNQRTITPPASTLEISDNIEEINAVVDNEQIAIEEKCTNVGKDVPNVFLDEPERSFNEEEKISFNEEEKIRQNIEKLSSVSSISDVDIHQNMSLMTRDMSYALENFDDIIVPTNLEKPLEIPLGDSFLGASSPLSNESQVHIKPNRRGSFPVTSTGTFRLNEPEPDSEPEPERNSKRPVSSKKGVLSGSFQLREPDCIGKVAETESSPPGISGIPTEDAEVIDQVSNLIVFSTISNYMSKKDGEYVQIQDNILGSEIVSKKIDTDSNTEAINNLLLGSESLETLVNQEKVETGIWTEIDSVAAAEREKESISLVPTSPGRSPAFMKSKIKKDTISSDFASLDSYKNSAKVGRIDLSFANEPEIIVDRIRKTEHTACFGSSLDSYRQSELVSLRRNSNTSTAPNTPRVRSGSGTPTIVEELEENESEHGSRERKPAVKLGNKNEVSHIVEQKIPKASQDGFMKLTTPPDSPTKTSVKDRIGNIQKQSSAQTLITPTHTPTLSPITPKSISPVPLELERPTSVKDFVTRIQQNSRIPMEALPVGTSPVSSFSFKEPTSPNHSLKSNGNSTLEIQKIESPVSTKSKSSSIHVSLSQDIPSTTINPVQSDTYNTSSVKDMIGKWGVQKDIPEKVREAANVNINSRRVSDRYTPLRKDVIDKGAMLERPESSRVKNMVGTWGAESSYKKKESEIVIGKLNK